MLILHPHTLHQISVRQRGIKISLSVNRRGLLTHYPEGLSTDILPLTGFEAPPKDSSFVIISSNT